MKKNPLDFDMESRLTDNALEEEPIANIMGEDSIEGTDPYDLMSANIDPYEI